MKNRPLSCISAVGLLTFAFAAPVQAVPRTFVSKSGGGATCSRAAPCADFQTAHNATDPGGEINCLDSGNFATGSTLNITKSITIDCGGTASTAAITAATGIQINGPNITVRLRNLSIIGTSP